MKRLTTQFEQLQQKAFSRWMEIPLLLLTIMVLQRYVCLIMLVLLVPISSIFYVPPILTRLLYRMAFREIFALFRHWAVLKSIHEKTYL